MCKKIDRKIFVEQFKEIVGKRSFVEIDWKEQIYYVQLCNEYDLRQYNTVPCLLWKEYAVG